jgi:G3E family GTPase
VQRWLNAEAVEAAHEHDHHDVNRHDDRIGAFCFRFDTPLEWQRLSAALQRLIADHGQDLLRIKGILHLAGQDRPVMIHGVRHVLYPAAALPAWPSGDARDSRLVFITRDLPRPVIADALKSLTQT